MSLMTMYQKLRKRTMNAFGLRKAVAHFYGDADERAARSRFEPFENLSAHYLLTGLYAGVGA